MRTIWRRCCFSILFVLVSVATACDKRSDHRFSPSALPDHARVVGLTIEGPATVPPGGTAQFSATQHFADGATRDVTAQAAWNSSNESVLSFSSTGLASGHQRGEVTVRAALGGFTTLRPEVMVLPTGTFRLSGRVTDADIPVPEATISVVAGQGSGETTIAREGAYILYGVAGPIELRARAAGYAELRQRVTVNAHETVNLQMTPAAPREQLAGRFTLTIRAAPSCAGQLPEGARVRTYTAIVTQDGPALRVKLEGAQFLSENSHSYDSFTGIVQPSRVLFDLLQPDFYYDDVPAVIEVLTNPASHRLWIGGTVLLTGSSRIRSGLLDGRLAVLSDAGGLVGSCESSEHGFVLSR